MNDHDRAVGVLDKRIAGRSEQQATKSTAASVADHDELRDFRPREQSKTRPRQIDLAYDLDVGEFLLPAGQLFGEYGIGSGVDLRVADDLGQGAEPVETQVAPGMHGYQTCPPVGRLGTGGADRGRTACAAVHTHDHRPLVPGYLRGVGAARHDDGTATVADDGQQGRAEMRNRAARAGSSEAE